LFAEFSPKEVQLLSILTNFSFINFKGWPFEGKMEGGEAKVI